MKRTRYDGCFALRFEQQLETTSDILQHNIVYYARPRYKEIMTPLVDMIGIEAGAGRVFSAGTFGAGQMVSVCPCFPLLVCATSLVRSLSLQGAKSSANTLSVHVAVSSNSSTCTGFKHTGGGCRRGRMGKWGGGRGAAWVPAGPAG